MMSWATYQTSLAACALDACSFQHPRNNPYTASAVSRGSAIMDVKLVILDEQGNRLDLGDNEVQGVPL
jgi:hypothetical protein